MIQLTIITAKGKKLILTTLVVIVMGLLQSCATIGYYSQSVNGHMSIWLGRQDIERLIKNKGADKITEKARVWFKRVLEIRAFATQSLALPDNYSFKSYSDIGRSHVLWNVVAAPEFSLTPKRFCFPVAGCLSYKGYFAKRKALREAQRLKALGYDVYVGPVSAYSTLGWFADPILSSFAAWSEDVLSGLMFHELAHQRVYIKGDTAFNESFATVVEIEGIRRWTNHRKQADLAKRYMLNKKHETEFIAMVLKHRKKLAKLYQSTLKDPVKRRHKITIFNQLRTEYTNLKKKWGGYRGYDNWMSHSLNNAKLASLSTYYKFVPAFQYLLKHNRNDMPAFYRAVKKIGAMPVAQRHAVLVKMMKQTS
ncbi:PUTATIVE ZINC PROTEASE PROTEIN, partial [hydrothermal vent metagenome]